jgi:PadR family transcriptional regulator, regulatory protein PadR
LDIQFKKGVLELCVLSLLDGQDRYGYELASLLSEKVNISSGTVYPVLRRLKTDGFVDTYLEESSGGPARKYFKLTNSGDALRLALRKEWLTLKNNISSIVKEGGNEK